MRITTTHDVAAAVRGRRSELRLTQAELADRVGVSRKWLSEFEAGKPRAEFALVVRVLEGVDLTLDLVDLPASTSGRSYVDLDDHLDRYRRT